MNKASNFYQIEGVKYDRVTRITGCIPKQDILINWAAKLTAEAAADVDQAEYQTKAIYVDAVKALSKERRNYNRDRGTEIHGAIEAHMTGQPVVSAYDNWVDEASKVLERYDIPQDARAEVVLVNVELEYAGTCDVIHGDTILDWKSGRTLYPDYLIQMWAYMEATHYVDANDKLKPITERAELGILARVGEYDYEVKELERGTQVYNFCGQTFEHLQGVRSWMQMEREM